MHLRRVCEPKPIGVLQVRVFFLARATRYCSLQCSKSQHASD